MTTDRKTIVGAYLKIEAHEALCAERYKGIEEKLHVIMAGLAAVVAGLMGWMAVQLYALEPLRVAAVRPVVTAPGGGAEVARPVAAPPPSQAAGP